MPKPNLKTHTLKSVELVTEKLNAISTSIRVSHDAMAKEPPVNEVDVNWQNALEIGLDRLQTWADSLRDAVGEKRMNLAVSDSKPKREKTSKTK